jgi:hypothetical protein
VARLKIEVVNWEKYNPRTDRKSHSWFRLENSIISEPKFFGLSAGQKFAAICILAEASKHHGTCEIHIEWLCDQIKIKKAELEAAIDKLVTNGVMRLPTGSITSSYVSLRTDERTNDTDERTDPKTPADAGSIPKVRDSFLEAYRKEFKRDYPGWGAKENGMVAKWLKSISLEEACRLARLYPMWNDPWVTKQGHPLGILVAQYVQVAAWASGSKQLIQKIAAGRAAENVDLKRAVEFEESKRGLEHRIKQSRGADTSRLGVQQRKLQIAAEIDLPPEPGNPFGEQVFEEADEPNAS